ncbi:MAG: bifunctional 5,10-methylenetetrahydrofolate dehydrogenase/5,10-methenyltetrahydrofolate cyclohydrolase [Candidatus Omnitrophota bacterium]
MAKLLAGSDISSKIQAQIKEAVARLYQQYNQRPSLCAVAIGEQKESMLYLEFQKKIADKLNINFDLKILPENISKENLIRLIYDLNSEKSVHGIILQLPMPEHLDANEIRSYLNPLKDVEGVHPENLGKIILNEKGFAPCTACAVIELLKKTGKNLYGKEAVIVGHSAIVGKPLSLMLLNEFCTVTVCHIGTSEKGNLAEHVGRAEILVVAVGKPNLIKGDWIKPGAIVIDVGINCLAEGKVVGDVEFESAVKKAAFITPVPGGVGPVTVSLLMENLVKAAVLNIMLTQKAKEA